MWSRTFALFLRALRVDARILPPHLMRLALLMFVGVTLMYSQVLAMMFSAPGLLFFTQITWINFGFGTLAGAFLFASAITEEKEERTLGLLRMANVGPLSLLVGKSAPRLVAALLILCVQFPFTLLAITLGGVSWTQVAAVFCTLVAHVVAVGAVALLFSVVLRRTGTAIALTFAVLICVLIIPPFLLGVLAPPWGTAPRPPVSPLVDFLVDYCVPALRAVVEASAVSQLNTILTTGFSAGPIGYQVLTNLAIGGLLFGLAWLVFDRCNRNLDDDVRKSNPLTGLLKQRRGRSRRAWRLAIVGKDFRAQAGGWTMLVIKLVVYASVVALLMYIGNDFRWYRMALDDFGKGLCILAFYFLPPIELTLLAARLFRAEVKDRTWPMLLSLPLSLPEIAYAKLGGALLALVPAAFYFILGSLLDRVDFLDMLGEMINEPAWFLAPALYGAYLLFLAHLTTFCSLLSNAWAGALIAIVTTVMGFFLNYMVAAMPVFLLIGPGGGPGSISPEVYIVVAGLVSLTVVLLLAGCLHFAIGARLRSAAAQ